jgi:DNA mismatch repair protein MutS
LQSLLDFVKRVVAELNDELPATLKEGGVFKKGFYSNLDELIDLHSNSRQILVDMEKRERERSGISSLKIRYNKIFGYYIV